MKKSHISIIVLAFLMLLTAVPLIIPTQAQETKSAWLKIVSTSWKRDPAQGNWAFPRPFGFGGFAERFNASNTCVEVWRENNDGTVDKGSEQEAVNATGFVQLKWSSTWENLTVVVKSKNPQGLCTSSGGTGASDLYSGIVVYMLRIGIVNNTFRDTSVYPVATFAHGINRTYTMTGDINATQLEDAENYLGNWGAFNNSGPADFMWAQNITIGKRVLNDFFASTYSTAATAWVARAAYIFKQFHVHTWYSIRDNLSYAQVKIYEMGDLFGATSEKSFVEEAVTSATGDGLSRYPGLGWNSTARTNQGGAQRTSGDRFKTNNLVPIPLMAVSPRNGTPYHGGTGVGFDRVNANGLPQLNTTVRVYWEKVLVGEVDYNGSVGPTTALDDPDDANPQDPAGCTSPCDAPTQNRVNATYHVIEWPTWFRGPDQIDVLTYALVSGMGDEADTTGKAGQWAPEFNPHATMTYFFNYTIQNDQVGDPDIVGVTNFLNASVFYIMVNATDADPSIDKWMGTSDSGRSDPLIGAEIRLNLLKGAIDPFLPKAPISEIRGEAITNDTALSGSGRDEGETLSSYYYRLYRQAGFSNWATDWPGALTISWNTFTSDGVHKQSGTGFTPKRNVADPDGEEGGPVPFASDFLDQHGVRAINTFIRLPNASTVLQYLNASSSFRARGASNDTFFQKGYIYDPSDAVNHMPDAISDPSVAVHTTYLKTRDLSDDPEFGGLGLELKWKGGLRNEYGGTYQLVNFTYLINPYSYAVHNFSWTSANNPLLQRPIVNGSTAEESDPKGHIREQWGDNTTRTLQPGAKHLNLTGAVYDLQVIVANDFAAPITGASVTLTRTNGPSLTLTTAFISGEEAVGPAVRFYQLPGRMGAFAGYPSGFSAKYEISAVVESVSAAFTEILTPSSPSDVNLSLDSTTGKLTVEPLTSSIEIKAKAATYKAKIVVTDCSGASLRNAAVWLTHPTLGTVERQADASGGIALDGPTGVYSLKYTNYKKTYVAPTAVIYPDGKVVLGGDVNITKSFQPDITVRFAIADLVVVTYDFDAEVKIPYLNVSLSWTSALATNTEAPDSKGDTADPLATPWNTTVTTTYGGTFGYDINYKTADAKTTFTQMPGREYSTTTGTSSDVAYSVKIYTVYYAGAVAGQDTSRAYSTTYRTPGYSKWTSNRLVQTKALSTNATTDGTTFSVGSDGTCSFESTKLTTWAHDFDLQVLDGSKRLADAEFTINAHFAQFQVNQSRGRIGASSEWSTVSMTDSKSKSDADLTYRNTDIGSALTTAREPKSDALYWWNSTYRITSLKFTAALSYNVEYFYNASGVAWHRNKVSLNYTFIVTPESTLSGKTIADQDYWPWPSANAPYIYENDIVKPELPVADIVLTVKDRGHTALPGAFIILSVFDKRPFHTTFTSEGAWATYTEFGVYTTGTPVVDPPWYPANTTLAGLIVSRRVYADSEGNYNFTSFPTHDWFSQTQAVDPRWGIKNYTISIFFDYLAQSSTRNQSARVFYESFNLTKTGYRIPDGGAVEVYNPTFYLAMSNSTLRDRAIKGLNFTAYYINQTVSEATGARERVYLTAFGSGWRTDSSTSTGSYDVWTDGFKKLSWVPGPKYMNTSVMQNQPSAYQKEGVRLNYTHVYFFRATHPDISSGTVNLLSTGTYGYVLNDGANETFAIRKFGASVAEEGDLPYLLGYYAHIQTHYFGGPASDANIHVPIAANASDVAVVAVTWRDENLVPTAYPIQNYLADVTLSGLGTSYTEKGLTLNDKGVVHFRGVLSDPKKIPWAGTTVRVKVYPPPDREDVDSLFYAGWLRKHGSTTHRDVSKLPDRTAARIPLVGAVNEVEKTTSLSFDASTGRSKPFVAQVDYTAITVRTFDFGGRPLVAAYVQIVEVGSGRIAGWSYTMADTYEARSIVMETLGGTDKQLDFSVDSAGLGTITPALETTTRKIGGAGYTALMNVSIPSSQEPKYIIRVYWLSQGRQVGPGVVDGDSIFPFIGPTQTSTIGRHINVYDSDADEVDIAAKQRSVKYLDGLHVDVTTQVFDLRLRFTDKDGKIIPLGLANPPRNRVDVSLSEVEASKLGRAELTTTNTGEILVQKLPRATYKVEAFFKSVPAGAVEVALNRESVGTGTEVQRAIALNIQDVFVGTTDLDGQPLRGAVVRLINRQTGETEVSQPGTETTVFFPLLVTAVPYVLEASWTSPEYGTSVSVPPSEVAADKLPTIRFPVTSVTIKVLDSKNRPVPGADLTFGRLAKKTDENGQAVFSKVPLNNVYTTEIKFAGITLVRQDLRPTATETSFTLLGALFDVRVQVRGSAGQGLAFATVIVKGPTVPGGSDSRSASPEGFAEFTGLPAGAYDVEVSYKGFTGAARVSDADLRAGRVVTVELPPYLEVSGLVLTFYTFLAIIIGAILLIIVVVVLLHEYITWRRRRLGIYLPPPPKK